MCLKEVHTKNILETGPNRKKNKKYLYKNYLYLIFITGEDDYF